MMGLNNLVKHLKNIFSECVHQSISLFPKQNSSNNMLDILNIDRGYISIHHYSVQMLKKTHNDTIMKNKDLIEEINSVYNAANLDRQKDLEKENSFIDFLLTPFKILTDSLIDYGLLSERGL